jgi:hypothetical protein
MKMKILKQLWSALSGAGSPAAPPRPVTPAASSHTPASPSEASEAARKLTLPRAARIQLGPLNRVDFGVIDPAFASTLTIANLSVSGVGFLKSSSPQWPAAGTIIRGALRFQGENLPVAARLVHVSSTVAGCAFVENTEVIRERISRYFRVELTALRMNVVSPKMLKPDPAGMPWWIYGDNNCELYFVTDPANAEVIRKFHVAFFGNYVEGTGGSPARFGRITEETSVDEIRKGSDVVVWDAEVPASQREEVVRFVENINHLSPGQRAALIASIRK